MLDLFWIFGTKNALTMAIKEIWASAMQLFYKRLGDSRRLIRKVRSKLKFNINPDHLYRRYRIFLVTSTVKRIIGYRLPGAADYLTGY